MIIENKSLILVAVDFKKTLCKLKIFLEICGKKLYNGNIVNHKIEEEK